MAKLISLGDIIIDANEIVWLNATQNTYTPNMFKISYYLRGIAVQFDINFDDNKTLRDKKYLEIKEAMESR